MCSQSENEQLALSDQRSVIIDEQAAVRRRMVKTLVKLAVSFWLLLMACGPYVMGVRSFPLPDGSSARVFCLLAWCVGR